MFQLNLDFKCAKDDSKSEEIKKYIREISFYILNQIGEKNVKSIILTGSFTVGEGAATIEKDAIKILSDFDLMVVTSGLKWIKMRKRSMKLSEELTNKMKNRGLLSHVCVTLTSPFFLKILKPSIRNFEFKNCDKIIWGDNVFRYVPYFKSQDIPKMDAIELLNNRMAEHIENFIENYNREQVFFYYQNSKFVIDTARSILVFENEYKSKYEVRSRHIKNIFKKLSLEKFLSPDYPKLVDLWTRFKLDSDVTKLVNDYTKLRNLSNNTNLSIVMWRDTTEILLMTWLFEIVNIKKIKKFDPEDIQQIKHIIKEYVGSFGSLSKAIITSFLYLIDNKGEVNNAINILKQRKHPKILINGSLVSLMAYIMTSDSEFLLLSYRLISSLDDKVEYNINWEYLARKTLDWWKKIVVYHVKP